MRPDFLQPTADDPMPPHMNASERLLLEQAVAGRRAIVEYGVGGSTAIFARSAAERIVSVDTDPAWIARVSQHPEVARGIADGRMTLAHVDIGPVGSWGRPIDERYRERWPDYARAPWSQIDAATVDFVFVDGRFRVASALTALLRGGPDLAMLIHDFWSRPAYHDVLRWVSVVAREDSMVLCVPNARCPEEREQIESTIESAQFNHR